MTYYSETNSVAGVGFVRVRKDEAKNIRQLNALKEGLGFKKVLPH